MVIHHHKLDVESECKVPQQKTLPCKLSFD